MEYDNKNTGQYKLTKNGNKMLTGKVSDPYQGDGFNDANSTPSPEFSKADSNELPF